MKAMNYAKQLSEWVAAGNAKVKATREAVKEARKAAKGAAKGAAVAVPAQPEPAQYTFGFDLVRAVVEAVKPAAGAGTLAVSGQGVLL